MNVTLSLNLNYNLNGTCAGDLLEAKITFTSINKHLIVIYINSTKKNRFIGVEFKFECYSFSQSKFQSQWNAWPGDLFEAKITFTSMNKHLIVVFINSKKTLQKPFTHNLFFLQRFD